MNRIKSCNFPELSEEFTDLFNDPVKEVSC